jgi:hypothetical protein
MDRRTYVEKPEAPQLLDKGQTVSCRRRISMLTKKGDRVGVGRISKQAVLQGIFQMLINFHDSCLITASVAVVRSCTTLAIILGHEMAR